jgi:hypothetical protein
MSEFEFEDRPRRGMWLDQNLLCCDCCINHSDEVPLLSRLKTCDLFLQIVHRIFVWLAYLLLLIVGILLVWYSYTLIISAKDWILEVWDTLYGYVMDFYDTLQQVYEFVLEIPSIVVDFFEDIGDKIVDDEKFDVLPF